MSTVKIVAPDAASELSQSVAQETLREMAAVVRTLFGVGLHEASLEARPTPAPAPAPPAPALPVTPLVPRPADEVAVALPVPGLPMPPAALAVPSLPDASGPGDPEHQQPLDRHSLSLLQEIAFLDD